MSRTHAKLAWGLVLAGVGGICLLLGMGDGRAQQREPQNAVAVESLLPADPILYFGWDGNAAHQAAWEGTAAYDALYKTGLMDVVHKTLAGLARGAGERPELRMLQDVLGHVSEHGLSLAVSVSAEAGPPLPTAVLVLHEAARLEPALSTFVRDAAEGQIELEERQVRGRRVTGTGPLPNTPGVELGWWTDGRHLVIAAGIDPAATLIAVAAGDAPNITASELWKKYGAAGADFELTSLGWFDFARLRALFGDMPLPPLPELQANTVNDVLRPLGLDGLGPIVVRSGYKGRAVWSETSVETAGPRRGLLAFCDQPAMTLGDLPPLPSEHAGFYASSVDWARTYDTLVSTVRDAAALGGPQVREQVDQLIENLPHIVQLDLRRELLEPLGNVLCVYGDSQQGLFGLGFGVAVQVKDAQTLRATLRKLAGIASEQTTADELRVRTVEKRGREIVTLGFGNEMFNPSYAVDDDWLVFGLLPQAVDAFLLRLDGELPAWEPAESYREAFGALPHEFTSITVTDPRKSIGAIIGFAPLLLPAIQAGLRDAGMLPEGDLAVPLAELPPAEQVARALFPNVTVSVVDENGVRWISRTSLPAIPLLGSGGGGTVATTAVLTALLLPAVQQAREAAGRAQSRNNLKQIALALHNYHDAYHELPQGTHPNDDLEPEERLSWFVDILPFLDQAVLFNQIDFTAAWNDDSTVNDDLMRTPLSILMNPGVAADPEADYGQAHYVGIAGVGKDAPTLPVTSEKAGVFGYNRKTQFRDVTDGLSNTMGVTEASGDFGPWGAGGRPTIRALTTRPYINGADGIGSPFQGGLHVMMMDGSVRFVSENIDPSVFEALSTIRGGEPLGDF